MKALLFMTLLLPPPAFASSCKFPSNLWPKALNFTRSFSADPDFDLVLGRIQRSFRELFFYGAPFVYLAHERKPCRRGDGIDSICFAKDYEPRVSQDGFYYRVEGDLIFGRDGYAWGFMIPSGFGPGRGEADIVISGDALLEIEAAGGDLETLIIHEILHSFYIPHGAPEGCLMAQYFTAGDQDWRGFRLDLMGGISPSAAPLLFGLLEKEIAAIECRTGMLLKPDAAAFLAAFPQPGA